MSTLLPRRIVWLRMFTLLACCLLMLTAARVLAQNAPNETNPAPRGWYLAGNKPANYITGVDLETVYHGRPSAFLKSKPTATEGFGTLMQDFSAEQYLGKRVRLTAFVKSEKVNGWSGLWIRVDKGTAIMAFDNMQDRPIQGTTDWQTYSVVLDVPPDATGIFFGILLEKGGQVWLNGVQFETVGTDVPITRAVTSAPQPKAPVNLNFEE
jgi:hypothetical protein